MKNMLMPLALGERSLEQVKWCLGIGGTEERFIEGEIKSGVSEGWGVMDAVVQARQQPRRQSDGEEWTACFGRRRGESIKAAPWQFVF